MTQMTPNALFLNYWDWEGIILALKSEVMIEKCRDRSSDVRIVREVLVDSHATVTR